MGLVLIILLFGAMTRQSGTFLTVDNWRTIAVQTVIVGIAALGMTIIMIAGGIDLSAGSTVALVTVCIAMFVKKVDPGLSDSLREMKLVLPLALLLGITIGGLCGAINGGLIAGLRVVPFIVTLGTYTVYRGFATWLASSTHGLRAGRRQAVVVQSDHEDRARTALASAWLPASGSSSP